LTGRLVRSRASGRPGALIGFRDAHRMLTK
jgi:hypothetical protein